MEASKQINNPGVRVVMYLSPSVYASGVQMAQRKGLGQREFFEHAVASACLSSVDDLSHEPPWSHHSVDLFLGIADDAHQLFEGPWKVLYNKVAMDESLWEPPLTTVGDIEDGELPEGWRINRNELIKAWPRLVSSAFVDCQNRRLF